VKRFGANSSREITMQVKTNVKSGGWQVLNRCEAFRR
jgi:hypothetical protein